MTRHSYLTSRVTMIFTRIRLLAAFVALLSVALCAQTGRRGDLHAFIDSTLVAMPKSIGTNEYLPPSSHAFDQFRIAVEALLTNDPAGSSVAAAKFGYTVIAFVDTTGPSPALHHILARHPDSTHHWGTVVVAAVPVRGSLILQCPHPIFDTNTGLQGAWIYRMTGARALYVSGTHRCNSLLASPCAGATTVCSGSTEPFRISDPAHSVDHPMQAATIAAIGVVGQPVIVQLHGFGKDPGDPDVILSNGTRSTPSNDLAVRLRDELLFRDDSLTFKVAHIDSAWNLLIGTTNVQGRLVNGSLAPCTQSAQTPSGRFIHMEQAWPRLRNNAASWSRVGSALAAAIPSSPMSIEPEIHPDSPSLIVDAYPNPFNPSASFRIQLPLAAQVFGAAYDLTGRMLETIVDGRLEAGTHHLFWSPRLPSGSYLCRFIARPEATRLPELTGSVRLVLIR